MDGREEVRESEGNMKPTNSDLQTIVIFTTNNDGLRMYLTRDGSSSADRRDASEYYAMQFDAIVRDYPGLRNACAEIAH